ncbi:hypothetical protein DQ384_37510 [Sphaerisporangium album]|uniref:DUF7824 domain-containing protein n=1 Tax=Sphaerisporangium album TaxID=509200 RepID=A0A367ERI3_9ACTN|nr:DUF6493 family protein [Sphaerisporangium album]RCG20205.1 hypothetical protein DQ384_37510 [Sphaerisporangium album]
MTAWDEVRDLIDAGDAGELIERLAGLDHGERKLVADELRGHIPVLRAHAEAKQWERWEEERRRNEGEEHHWRGRPFMPVREPWEDWADLMRLAGAGTLSAVTAVAAWVTRGDFLVWRPFTGRTEFGDPAPVVRLLAHRPAQWQAELAVRLASRLRGPRDAGGALALAMLRHTGAEPPAHDPLVVAWLTAGPGPAPETSALAGQEREEDPLLLALLPRIFEAEGAGRALRNERAHPISPWLRKIRDLARAGSVSRESLLDGCVRRFLRGGSAQDLRFFVRLHELLDPSETEVEARRRDHLRLLPSAPGPVAELALRHLRRLDDHALADVVEALEGLLFRAEASLARPGLTWLDQTVLKAPERADELAPALATALQHQSSEVRHRATQLALKHARLFSPLGAERIREAVPALPPASGERLAAVFGGEVAAAPVAPPFAPPPIPEPPRVRAFPSVPDGAASMRSLGRSVDGWWEAERWLAGFVRLAGRDRQGLAEALERAHAGTRHPNLFDLRTWTNVEYWQEAIAKELITPGVEPPVPPDPSPVMVEKSQALDVSAFFAALAHAGTRTPEEEVKVHALEQGSPAHDGAGHDGAEPEGPGHDGAVTFTDLPTGLWYDIFSGAGLTTLGSEVALDVGPADEREEHATEVVAYHCDARADPARLSMAAVRPRSDLGSHRPQPEVPRDRLPDPHHVSRPHMFVLRRFAEVLAALKSGMLPPVLLATPTWSDGTLDPDVLVSRLEECEAAQAAPLPADLGQALLRLPRGAHLEAAARAARLASEAGRTVARLLAAGGIPDPEVELRWGYIEGATEYYLDERPPADSVHITLRSRLKFTPTGLDAVDELLTEPVGWTGEVHGGYMTWWTSIMPSHREVVAAHMLPHLLYQWNRPGVYPAHAAMLAPAGGPAGAATALIVAYFLAQPDGGHGVQVLLTMAARGDLPAAELGVQLGLLIRWTWFKQRHILEALNNAAERGAHHEVWQVLRALVPARLPAAGERPRGDLAGLVGFAVTVAQWTEARGEIPEVAAVAGRKGGGMFVQECRRLHEHLTRP